MPLDPNTDNLGTGEDLFAATERTVAGALAKNPHVLINAFDGPSCDAFGRWRVSAPVTVFDSKLTGIDDAPLFWQEVQVSGSSTTPTTPTASKPYVDLASANTTAGRFVRQTFRRFAYQPGKSQMILMTGVLELASGVKTGCERRIGYFDDDNGLFFESDAGTLGVTVRSNDSGTPVDTTVAQASWNLDRMNGAVDETNPSGITVDWSKAQLFVIDFQWLSTGRVRFGLEIDGIIFYVHEHNAANVSAIPYMSTPNLPLRYELISTTDSGVCSMRAICSAVISEGGTDEIGIVHRTSTAGAGVTTDAENIIFAVVGIRLKAARVGTTIRLLEAALQIHTASEFIEWLVIWNPTVADTFTYSDIVNSALQRALGATANRVTGGTIIGGGYIETGGGNSGGNSSDKILNSSLILGVDYAGTNLDELVLCARPIGGVVAADVEGSLTWRETL